MSGERKAPEAFSLRRWSQRKLAAAREERSSDAARAPVPAPVSLPEANAPAPVSATDGPRHAPAPVERADDAKPALPPVESLTFDSDFTAFMQPGVDENVRRGALRTLLRDPRFNVMDGLDVYIDDYSKPDPIEPELVRTLVQARYLFDPPKTRVNAEGFVEDVVDEAAESAEDTAADAPPPEDAVTQAPAPQSAVSEVSKEQNDDERA